MGLHCTLTLLHNWLDTAVLVQMEGKTSSSVQPIMVIWSFILINRSGTRLTRLQLNRGGALPFPVLIAGDYWDNTFGVSWGESLEFCVHGTRS